MLLLLPYAGYFAVRMVCLKTWADTVFLFATFLVSVLNMFWDRSRVCRWLIRFGCVAMCALALVLHINNTFFDPAYPVSFVLWLALLLFLLLDSQPCISA